MFDLDCHLHTAAQIPLSAHTKRCTCADTHSYTSINTVYTNRYCTQYKSCQFLHPFHFDTGARAQFSKRKYNLVFPKLLVCQKNPNMHSSVSKLQGLTSFARCTTYAYTSAPKHIHTNTNARIHTYMHACIHVCMPCMHTYMHTYTHHK